MRRYIEHIKNNHSTHQRRQHAMRISGVITATLFAVWLGTLGTRIASQEEEVAAVPETSNETLSASAAAAVPKNSAPQLQVSTTSVFQ